MARKLYFYGRWLLEEPYTNSSMFGIDTVYVKVFVKDGTIAQFFKGLPGRREALRQLFSLFAGFERRLGQSTLEISDEDCFDVFLHAASGRLLGKRISEILESHGLKTRYTPCKINEGQRVYVASTWVSLERESPDTWELTIED